MIRTRQKDISNFVRRNESRKQVKLSIFSTHCSCLIYLWLLGALHMIPSVIYSFPHNSRCVVCILDYPTLPLIMRETYLIIPFALDRRRMKERKHLQQWFQFLILIAITIITVIEMKIYQLMSLIPLETLSFISKAASWLFMSNIVEDTVVKEYILIVSKEDTKSLFA